MLKRVVDSPNGDRSHRSLFETEHHLLCAEWSDALQGLPLRHSTDAQERECFGNVRESA